MDTRSVGLVLAGVGAALLTLGLVVHWGGFSWFGRLPGDIRYESETTRVFVPLTSMILLSVLATLALNLLRRLF
ncbi:MAG TPA: DUF2905 domain-containing protein [Vicinamibacteria bacterium]|nr:DUF2905 domain-containing protein [Vicinamibacteria bacterium]